MNRKHFYSHLIDIDDIWLVCAKHVKTPEDEEELKAIIEEIIHHSILEHAYTKLHKSKHDSLSALLAKKDNHSEILTFLKQEIAEDIENQFKLLGKKLKEEVKSEIQKSMR